MIIGEGGLLVDDAAVQLATQAAVPLADLGIVGLGSVVSNMGKWTLHSVDDHGHHTAPPMQIFRRMVCSLAGTNYLTVVALASLYIYSWSARQIRHSKP